MKKITIVFLTVFVLMIFAYGCAGHSSESQNVNENKVEDNNGGAEEIPAEGEKNDEEVIPSADVEVSDKSAVVPYSGEEFEKSVFAVGDTMLYICGIKPDGAYFLGCMQREEDIFREFTIEMDEDMRAFNMAVDRQGRCHILWMSVEKFEAGGQSADRITYEKSRITIVDNTGKLEKEIDVTDLFSAGYKRPFCFVVDRDGNYYFEHDKELVQIRNDGTPGNVILCDGWVEGIGIGKSGTLYCTYQQENGERRLGRIEEGMLCTIDVQFPQSKASYAGVYAGTDSELFIFNKESGVFAFDGDDLKTRVAETELPIKGPEIAGYGILSDGRLCIMEQKDGTVFYYVPAGK